MVASEAYLSAEANFFDQYQKLPRFITEAFETAFFRSFLLAAENVSGLKTKCTHAGGFESLYLEGGNPNGETLV